MRERQEAMVGLVNAKGSVSFASLKEAFPHVSEMTLRRDLEFLDREKRIIRIHGGAKSVEVVIGTDDLFLKRTMRNAEAKKLIARKAAELVSENTSVFIDSGTTATEFSRVFPDGRYLLFTSGVSCALELARLTQAQVYILGGRLNHSSLSINGSRSLAFLENVSFQAAFMGVTGYIHGLGFTCGSEEECELKRAVIRKAEKVILLMDAQKVGIANTFTFCGLEDVDAVVSDPALPEATRQEFEKHNIRIY
ncbi:MAG TPA: DeoR/GlpR family DNA-binding transcription regulator [Candidatus Limnocylindria bacterium]|nr:DeoR/GlpR family DNA-binding transcription regulator [Candidatus Limnocylindria bacterium]